MAMAAAIAEARFTPLLGAANHGFAFCRGLARRAEFDPRVWTPSAYGPLKFTLNE